MSRRSIQPSTASAFLRNLKALGFDQAIQCKNTKVVVDEQTFTLHPNNIKAFEIISYFLFQLLDKKKTNIFFKDVWPVIDINRSIGYRQRAFEWLKDIQPGTALMNVPLRKSYFGDCRGEHMNKIFIAFTAHVIENQRSNNKKDIGTIDSSSLNKHHIQTEIHDDQDKFMNDELRLNTAEKRSTEYRPGNTEDLIHKRLRTLPTSKIPDVSLAESKEGSQVSTGSYFKESISAKRKQSVHGQESHEAMRERFNRARQEGINNERLFTEHIAARNKEIHRAEKKHILPERTQDESESRARVEQELRFAEHRLAQLKEEEQAEKERVFAKRQEQERAEQERKEKELAEEDRISAEFLLIRQEQENLLAFCKEQELKAKEIEADERSAQEVARKQAEQKEAERKEAVRKEAERKHAEKREAEKKEAERKEAEKKEAEIKEAERKEAVRKEAAKIEAAREEAARKEAERKEAERKEAERREAERREAERREAERKEAARREAERKEAARREAEKKEAERKEAIRKEAIRKEALRKEAEKKEAARKEAARKEAVRKEAERMEAKRMEAERMEAERKEAERKKAEKMESARKEAARMEAERKEAERVEAERVEAEQIEAKRIEAERFEAERIEAEIKEAEIKEAEIKEAERKLAQKKEAEAELVAMEKVRRQALEQQKLEQAKLEASNDTATEEFNMSMLSESFREGLLKRKEQETQRLEMQKFEKPKHSLKIQRLVDQRLGEYITRQKEEMKEILEKDPRSLMTFLLKMDTEPEMDSLSRFEPLHFGPNPDSVIFPILDTPLDKVNSDAYVSSTPSPSIAANNYQSSHCFSRYIERTPYIADIFPSHESTQEAVYKSMDEVVYEPTNKAAHEPTNKAAHEPTNKAAHEPTNERGYASVYDKSHLSPIVPTPPVLVLSQRPNVYSPPRRPSLDVCHIDSLPSDEELPNPFMDKSSPIRMTGLQTRLFGSSHESPSESFQGIEDPFLSESPEIPESRQSIIKRNEYSALPRTPAKGPKQSPLRNSFINRPAKGSPLRNSFVTAGRRGLMGSPVRNEPASLISVGAITHVPANFSEVPAIFASPERQTLRGVDDDDYDFTMDSVVDIRYEQPPEWTPSRMETPFRYNSERDSRNHFSMHHHTPYN